MLRNMKKKFKEKDWYIAVRKHLIKMRTRGYRNLSDREFINKDFRHVFGYDFDNENPKGYHEVMAWYKMQDYLPTVTPYVDKYVVRDHVAKLCGDQYLIPMIRTWDGTGEFDFDSLPDKYVLIPNHASGLYFIQDGTKAVNRKKLMKQMREWLAFNFYDMTREPQYKTIKPLVMVMEYLEDTRGSKIEYKYSMLEGRINYIIAVQGHGPEKKFKKVDSNWQPLVEAKIDDDKLLKSDRPEVWQEMEAIALKLAEGFPFLRVDLYEIEGRIYFGEMTFTPGGSCFRLEPEDYNIKIGDMIYKALVKVTG